MTSEPNRTLTAFLATALLLLLPSTVYASGDPLVLFSMLVIAIFHFGMAGFILLAKMCAGIRAPVVIVYLSIVVMAWLWGLDYVGPGVVEMYLRLTIGPAITFVSLIWLLQFIKRQK